MNYEVRRAAGRGAGVLVAVMPTKASARAYRERCAGVVKVGVESAFWDEIRFALWARGLVPTPYLSSDQSAYSAEDV